MFVAVFLSGQGTAFAARSISTSKSAVHMAWSLALTGNRGELSPLSMSLTIFITII